MNVLLLAMSTLPWKIKESNVSYLKNNVSITKSYLGQLEPVPMMLSDTLEGRLDKIIVLASKDTLEKIGKQIETEDGKITISEEESAFGFFEKRMADLGIRSEIVKIELEQNMLQKAMEKTVAELRQLKKENKDFNLYLDMHGGPRDNQLIFDAIISLLRTEGIEVKGSYTLHDTGNRNNYTIDSTDNSLKLFEFVAGMNEFLNYARSATLERFFGQGNELVECIGSVCDSIQLCQMDEFENNLKALGKKLDSTIGKDNDDNYLELFISTIKNDYGKLLLNPTICDTLDWCIKKEFYQQALTIVESQVPKFLFEQKIITLENAESLSNYSGTAKKTYTQKERDISCPKTLLKVAKKNHKNWQNYVFEKCIWKNCLFDNNRPKTIELREFQNYENISLKKNNEIALEPIKSYEYKLDKSEVKQIESDINDEKYKRKPDLKINNGNLEIKIKVNSNDLDMFNRFTQLHLALKKQRNFTNHAGEGNERESLNDIKTALEVYTKVLNEMMEKKG